MSGFECPVVAVQIEPHLNADSLEIAKVGDYQSVVRKDQFKTGDLAVYIPEQALVPEPILREIGLWDEEKSKGRLAGSAGNRVKAIKLRSVLSQGLLYRPHYSVFLTKGSDLSSTLGITKYEPPIPSHMRGTILGVNYEMTFAYDFDNIKKMPDLFEDGEEVVMTEKIHGTFMMVGVVPESEAIEKYYKGRVILSSKGMGGKGILLDHNDESNLYVQAAKAHNLLDKMLDAFNALSSDTRRPVWLLGEVFGKTASGANVQDLPYTDMKLAFRVFDLLIGGRNSLEGDRYYDFDDFLHFALKEIQIMPVPVLYRGPFSKNLMLEHTVGETTLEKKHIREGIVIKSVKESLHPIYGRKIAKSISEQYLLRKGEGTEYQ